MTEETITVTKEIETVVVFTSLNLGLGNEVEQRIVSMPYREVEADTVPKSIPEWAYKYQWGTRMILVTPDGARYTGEISFIGEPQRVLHHWFNRALLERYPELTTYNPRSRRNYEQLDSKPIIEHSDRWRPNFDINSEPRLPKRNDRFMPPPPPTRF